MEAIDRLLARPNRAQLIERTGRQARYLEVANERVRQLEAREHELIRKLSESQKELADWRSRFETAAVQVESLATARRQEGEELDRLSHENRDLGTRLALVEFVADYANDPSDIVIEPREWKA